LAGCSTSETPSPRTPAGELRPEALADAAASPTTRVADAAALEDAAADIRLMAPAARPLPESRTNIVPSIASSRPTMRSCSPVKYSAALSMSIVMMLARRDRP
jgi:hypothetical protein